MGILDHAKEGADKSLAEKVQKILSDKASIEDLKVSVEEGVVTLRGKVADEDAKNAAIKLVKGLDGVAKIRTGLKLPEDKVHTVVAGDTLWGLSEKYYGDGSKYMKIFEANKEVWKDYNYDPNVIYVGWELDIPKL